MKKVYIKNTSDPIHVQCKTCKIFKDFVEFLSEIHDGAYRSDITFVGVNCELCKEKNRNYKRELWKKEQKAMKEREYFKKNPPLPEFSTHHAT